MMLRFSAAGCQAVVLLKVYFSTRILCVANQKKRDASSRWLRRVVLPVDPLDGMRRPVGAHCLAESREESLFPETCEESETLHLVLDRILHLGETQLDVGSVESVVELIESIGRGDVNAGDRLRRDYEPADGCRRAGNGI